MQSIRNFINDMDQRRWASDAKTHAELMQRIESLRAAQDKTDNPVIKIGYQKMINRNLEWIKRIEAKYPNVKF